MADNSAYACKPCEHRRRRPLKPKPNGHKRVRPNQLQHTQLDRIRNERKVAYAKLDEADKDVRDGFVYIIKMHGQDWLKIGHARDPYQRVKSVKSFLPEDPEVYHMVYSDDRYRDEKEVHKALETYRHASGKELFICGVELAKEVLDDYVSVRPGSGWPTGHSLADSWYDDSASRPLDYDLGT